MVAGLFYLVGYGGKLPCEARPYWLAGQLILADIVHGSSRISVHHLGDCLNGVRIDMVN